MASPVDLFSQGFEIGPSGRQRREEHGIGRRAPVKLIAQSTAEILAAEFSILVLAFLAALARTVEIATGSLILPKRYPVFLAKGSQFCV